MSDNCQLVVFSNKAYNAIIRESFDKDPVETGGILLGHVLDNGVWIVMEVLPPGINSIFQYAYFEYDEAFVNYLAQSVANQYKRPLDLLGLWHRHPGSMDIFSSTDDGTNATFARQNPAGVISGLVNIDPLFRLTMYHLDSPTHRLMERPNYDVVKVEVGDDIIPEEYFELRYYDGEGSSLHPTVNSRGRERQVKRDLQNENREVIGAPQDQSLGNNSKGLDIKGIISRGLSPCKEPQNVTPKPINDFFSFWRTLNKKWLYVLIAVIALTTCVYSIKSCGDVIEGLSNEKFDNVKLENDKELTPSLSMESITFTAEGESKTIEIENSTSAAHWTSSNTKCCTVDNGKVTAISNGYSTIEATIGDKLVGRCEVLVSIPPQNENPLADQVNAEDRNNALIDTDKTYNHGHEGSIKIGDSFVIPIKKTGNPKVTFSSSKPEIATIDINGNVTAKKVGKTEIQVLCDDVETDKFNLNVTK